MLRFHTCPCCAGGDLITVETGEALKQMLDHALRYGDKVIWVHPYVETELKNIRNAILNAQQGPRVPPIDPLLQ